MDMHCSMSLTDQWLWKLLTLPVASRSIILQKMIALREAQVNPSFRTFKAEMEAKREKEVDWNCRMMENVRMKLLLLAEDMKSKSYMSNVLFSIILLILYQGKVWKLLDGTPIGVDLYTFRV